MTLEFLSGGPCVMKSFASGSFCLPRERFGAVLSPDIWFVLGTSKFNVDSVANVRLTSAVWRTNSTSFTARQILSYLLVVI